MDDHQGQQRPWAKFRGRSEHSLDDKGRLHVPARIQEALRQLGDERLMVVPWHKCIKAYPMVVWEDLEEKLLASAQEDPSNRLLVEHMIGGVEECPLKQGRLLLPARLREQVGIKREVVLEGMLTLLRIWDRQTWELENKPTLDDFRRFDDRLAQFGTF